VLRVESGDQLIRTESLSIEEHTVRQSNLIVELRMLRLAAERGDVLSLSP